MNLIPRLYDVTEGSVLIDGINVKDYDITSLRDMIGVVLQKMYFSQEQSRIISVGESRMQQMKKLLPPAKQHRHMISL